jgi:pimeloyl-ACP methyl ester carboxylesterase
MHAAQASHHAPRIRYEHFNVSASLCPHFIRSYLSTVRYFPLIDMQDNYTIVGKLGLPTTVLWGTADMVVPIAAAAYANIQCQPTDA